MSQSPSVQFFDAQFQRQVARVGDGGQPGATGDAEAALNPFERLALPHVRGDLLDYGCGLGHLSVAAARRGCRVLALDASPTAIAHLDAVARREALPIRAREADLSRYRIEQDYDTVVCIGLLMFFDGPTAWAQLEQLQAHVRPGGVAILNVLLRGTDYLEMFDPAAHCLFDAEALLQRFAGWDILGRQREDFPAPGGTRKSFLTLIARKPGTARPPGQA